MMRSFVVVLVFACSSCVGCRDECVEGSAECIDNVARNCSTTEYRELGRGPLEWTGRQCEDAVCVVATNDDASRAFCAMSGSPDERCSEMDQRCDGDDAIVCSFGYVVSEETCEFCKSEEGLAFCSLSDTPDPACENPSTFSTCRDLTKVYCFFGYATEEELCDDACVVSEFSSVVAATCAASSEPDPACRDSSEFTEGLFWDCNQSPPVECFGEYLVQEDPERCG